MFADGSLWDRQGHSIAAVHRDEVHARHSAPDDESPTDPTDLKYLEILDKNASSISILRHGDRMSRPLLKPSSQRNGNWVHISA